MTLKKSLNLMKIVSNIKDEEEPTRISKQDFKMTFKLKYKSGNW